MCAAVIAMLKNRKHVCVFFALAKSHVTYKRTAPENPFRASVCVVALSSARSSSANFGAVGTATFNVVF